MNFIFKKVFFVLIGLLWSILCYSQSFSIFQNNTQFSHPKNGASNLFPVRDHASCELALLSSGPISLVARLKVLKEAKRSIRIRALIFTADESGLYITRLLKQKAKEGLKVVVMVDSLSNLSWRTQWMYYDLRLNGVEVEGYELPWQAPFSKLLNLKKRNKRYHDKLWLIDGEDEENAIVIAGGMNIANEYFRIGGDSNKLWEDKDVAARGAIVQDAMHSFDQDYRKFKEFKHSRGFLFNTDRTWEVWRNLCKRMSNWTVEWLGSKPRIPFVIDRFRKLEVELFSEDTDQFEFDFRPVTARFFQSRPRYYETYIHDAYVKMIRDASVGTGDKEILIVNAYFLPREEIRKVLKQAVRSGVNVRILTNSKETNDLPQLSYVSRALYQDLLSVNHEDQSYSGTMRIFEWQGDHLYGTLHAKVMVVNRKAGIIGSYNLDPRSELLNSETVLAFEDAQTAEELANNLDENNFSRGQEVSWKEAKQFASPKQLEDKLMLSLSLLLKDQL